jgi:hypothetical protein
MQISFQGLCETLPHVSAELKRSQFSRFKGEPLRSPAVHMHTSTLAAFGNVSSHSCEFFTANSQFKHAPPAPSTPARTAEFRCRRYSSRLIERAGSNFSALRTAAPERMQALGLSVGVVGKFSEPVTQHSQRNLPDEHDIRSAFPSYLSKSRLWRSSNEMCGEGIQLVFSHGLYVKRAYACKAI